jgi:hypothetical protein
MAYVQALGHCILCEKVFAFNPLRVPSLRVDGERRPVCAECIQLKVNPYRESQGLEPVVPEPDAYEEIQEEELNEHE